MVQYSTRIETITFRSVVEIDINAQIVHYAKASPILKFCRVHIKLLVAMKAMLCINSVI